MNRAIVAAAFVIAATSRPGWAEERVPVVVELFTSEGCSSCPAADELLAKMERSQPWAHARIIALEEHVDYWNQLGWTDRFSSPLFGARQNEYAQLFQTQNVYTPQMVVNGHAAFVGNDPELSRKAIGEAATIKPSYTVRLEPQPNLSDPELTDLTVMVRNNRGGQPEAADVYLAITEARLTTFPHQGENAGTLLRHAPVVRSFGVIGKIDAKPFGEAGLKPTLKMPNAWRRDNLRAVVFVQERASRRISAAATADLR